MTAARRNTANRGAAHRRPGRFGTERGDVLADDGDHPAGDDRQEHQGRYVRGHGPPGGRVGSAGS